MRDEHQAVLHLGTQPLVSESLAVESVDSLSTAVERLTERPFSAVVCEHDLPGSESGLSALERIREFEPDIPIIFVTAAPDGRLASQATKLGATEYVAWSGPESVAERVRAHLDADRPVTRSSTDRSAFRTVSDSVSDMVVTIDSDSTIVYANESTTTLTGYDRETLVGQSLTSIMPDRFEQAHHAGLAAYEQSGERTIDWDYTELLVEHADGHEIPVSVSFGEFSRNGRRYYTGVIRDISEQKRREAELEESQDALQRLYDIASRTDQSFEAKLDALLELGCERLGVEYGYLNRLEADHLRVEQSRGLEAYEGESIPVEYTYCRETVATDGLVPITDTTTGRWAGTKPTETFDMQCYLGGRITVDGELYGTLCFADREARENDFTEAQRTFVELIVQWLSYELERRRHESMLTSLLETTRALMQAPTTEAVAEEIVDAAKEVLGFELNLVRLYDPERGVLRPAAMTDETKALMGERPLYEPGEGVPGQVYQKGESVLYSDVGEPVADDVEETLCLPLGEFGTLTLSSYSLEHFDSSDRQVAEILAATAEAALGRAERAEELARYKTVMETVTQMVFVVDDTGSLSLVTGPLADRLGYERASLDGMDARALVEAADVAELSSVLARLFADGDDTEAQLALSVRTSSGASFPATVALSALPGDDFGGAVGVVYDRTELAETKAQLADERDRFTDLFENIPDAVVEVELVDGVPEVLSTNAAFESVFGWSAEAVIGTSLTDRIVPEEDRLAGEQLARRAAAGEVLQAEVRRRTADGLGYFLFRGVPYDVGEERTRAFAIYTDITEQRTRQRQLQVLNRVFRHNLRNDLTVVLGAASHVREAVEDPELRSVLSMLLAKGRGLSEMSETVRDIEETVSRGTATGDVDATAIVEDVVSEYRQRHPAAEIRVEGPASLHVAADEHLQVAVDQLVENALKHTQESPEVCCSLSQDGDWVTISVLDNGPGIPETEQIVADDGEIDQLNHASGLGLWLVRWIVDSYGGRLELADRPEGGAEVSITIPRVGA